MDTDSFIVCIKTEDIYVDIAKDGETRFGALNYELKRPLSKVKNKKVIGLIKVDLGRKIMTEFAALRPKAYSYLIDNGDENKKARSTKKCVIKFGDYKYCLEATQLESKINKLEKNKLCVDCLTENSKEFLKNNKLISKLQKRFRSEKYNVFPEEVNKIALCGNNDRGIQSIDSIETYAYGTSKDLVCEREEIECDSIVKQYKNDSL